VASVSHLGPTYLGLDVHKDTISVAILAPDRDRPDEVVALSLIPKAPGDKIALPVEKHRSPFILLE
jgi:hypothetical protein